MPYTYEYPRPMVTVDCVVIKQEKTDANSILLIKRKHYPYKGKWALPGGFVNIDEDLEDAAIRELEEETGIKVNKMKQLFTVGTPNRDPRGRTITVVYFTFVDKATRTIASDDADDASWFLLDQIPQDLAFDHNMIIYKTLQYITGK